VKTSDRAILIGLLVAGAFAAFWFLALAPKRDEVSKLDEQVTQLEGDLAAQQQRVADSREAQDGYQENFSSLVVLGKAAPPDGDMPSLMRQLIDISEEAKVDFGRVQLGTAAEEPTPATAESTTDQAGEGEAPEGASTATPAASTTPAPATEASAAALPLGASVGSAGLGRLVYDLYFEGDFFQIADLFEGIDQMIDSKNATVDVSGRLVTVNGFEMTKSAEGPLTVELSISAYSLPESQGLTAGATSTMPPANVPAATAVSESTP
jgi:hypothetical protein